MTDSTTTDLKALLSKVPMFKDIKPKMMEALLESVSFRRAPLGEVLVRQGEYTESLYLMVRGIATAYRTEPDGRVENMGSHGVDDWFGEMTALANQPQFATVKAETPSLLLEIDAPLFKKLYTGGGSFRELIDARYRSRALAVHLRSSPALRDLPRDHLKALSKAAELITYEEGKTIAEEGKPTDGVYMVRSGIVKEMIRDGSETRVASFLRDNSSFGEQCILAGGVWPSSMVAMTRVDVVLVPKAAFDLLLNKDRETGTKLRARVELLESQR
ncbi:MAG TPA: cyclic nucleotide-binding domain-containing protein, partial [Planctomycetota bacterium]|nr:cyclic nucleotide-binding domain-containing protein [Planctomycetota bacterium]